MRQYPAWMTRIAVVDIDGVIADVRHRLHFVKGSPRDWDGFFDAAAFDGVLSQGRAWIDEALASDLDIVYLTGRPERCRAATQDWLAEHGFPTATLLMRGDRDRRPARLLKVQALVELQRSMEVVSFLDDDPVVVEDACRAGFPAVHAAWMSSANDPADDTRVLGFVQEELGRT